MKDPVPWQVVEDVSFFPEQWLRHLQAVDPSTPLVHVQREEKTGWSFIPRDLSRLSSEAVPGALRVPVVDGVAGDPDCRPPFYSGLVCLVPFPGAGDPDKTIIYRCRSSVAYDHRRSRLFIPVPLFETAQREGWWRRSGGPAGGVPPVSLVPDISERRYREKVGMVLRGIGEGRFYQVNLAMEFACADPGIDPLVVHYRLDRTNPSPGAAFYSDERMWLVSNSPERLFSVSGGTITTSPIAGTLSLSQEKGFGGNDRSFPGENAFREDPKEHAEHVMTVDLLRNDLGKICRSGSVHVSRLLGVERYRHLWHLVSDVRGELLPGVTLGQVLDAMMPGGSVTGAPKKASTEEILALESFSRGYYCGSLGLFDPETGFGDFNLLIRTVFQEGGRIRVPVGSGLVSDSDPEKEYEEIRSKCRAIAEVLGGN